MTLGFSTAGLNASDDRIVTFKTTLHEDNQGALALAESPAGRDTPRSKFYALKLHWLRPWLEPKKAELRRAKPAQQKAGFLAKALATPAYKDNRSLPMGW